MLLARGDIFGLTELKAHDSGVMRLHTWSWLNLKMTLSYIQESRNIVCNDMIFLLLNSEFIEDREGTLLQQIIHDGDVNGSFWLHSKFHFTAPYELQ